MFWAFIFLFMLDGVIGILVWLPGRSGGGTAARQPRHPGDSKQCVRNNGKPIRRTGSARGCCRYGLKQEHYRSKKQVDFMASDPKRLSEAYRHIQRIKASDYPVIMGNSIDGSGNYRIVDRPWQELAEPSKLAILQDAVDWSHVTNKDQATILLSEIDPGRITDAQRTRLIDAALGKDSYQEMLREASARGGTQKEKDIGIER